MIGLRRRRIPWRQSAAATSARSSSEAPGTPARSRSAHSRDRGRRRVEKMATEVVEHAGHDAVRGPVGWSMSLGEPGVGTVQGVEDARGTRWCRGRDHRRRGPRTASGSSVTTARGSGPACPRRTRSTPERRATAMVSTDKRDGDPPPCGHHEVEIGVGRVVVGPRVPSVAQLAEEVGSTDAVETARRSPSPARRWPAAPRRRRGRPGVGGDEQRRLLGGRPRTPVAPELERTAVVVSTAARVPARRPSGR